MEQVELLVSMAIEQRYLLDIPWVYLKMTLDVLSVACLAAKYAIQDICISL